MSGVINHMTRVEDGWVHFNFEEEPTDNLKKYCDILCVKKCGCGLTEEEILNREEDTDTEPLCDGCMCEVALLYNAMWKLAEFEAQEVSDAERN